MTACLKKKVLIVGSSGYICNQHAKSLEYLLKVSGENTGNLIFQYATRKLLSDSQSFVNIGIDERFKYQDVSVSIHDFSCAIIPAANHLRANADWSGFNNFLERIPIPLLVLGLGAQGELNDSFTDTISALKGNKTVLRMCQILADKATFVGVRGIFTAEICEAMGIHKAEPLGCPSLMINPSPHLGKTISDKIQCINGSSDMKPFAVAAEAPWALSNHDTKKISEQQLIKLAIHNNSYYIQQSGGPQTIAFATASNSEHLKESSWESFRQIIAPNITSEELRRYLAAYGRVFFSASDWIDFCSSLSFVIGLRIHGCMAAIAAGTPGIVIKHDARVSELADTMGIPSIDMAEISKYKNLQLDRLKDSVRFDSEIFDKNRAHVARRIIHVFSQHNIDCAEKLRIIGNIN
jgi:hypothetical protein